MRGGIGADHFPRRAEIIPIPNIVELTNAIQKLKAKIQGPEKYEKCIAAAKTTKAPKQCFRQNAWTLLFMDLRRHHPEKRRRGVGHDAGGAQAGGHQAEPAG